jgi:hypothetical protein
MSGTGTSDGRYSDSSPDGIDDDVWRRLCEIVDAASKGNADSVVRDALRWPAEVSLAGQQRAGLYLRALMEYRIKEILQRKPTEDDLGQLAVRVFPNFSHILPLAGQWQLEEALRRACRMAPRGASIPAGEFMAFGAVALGVLLDNPNEQLLNMRPHVAAWWRRNQDKFPEQVRTS